MYQWLFRYFPVFLVSLIHSFNVCSVSVLICRKKRSLIAFYRCDLQKYLTLKVTTNLAAVAQDLGRYAKPSSRVCLFVWDLLQISREIIPRAQPFCGVTSRTWCQHSAVRRRRRIVRVESSSSKEHLMRHRIDLSSDALFQAPHHRSVDASMEL